MVISTGDSRTRDRVRRFPIDSKLGSSSPPASVGPVNVTESVDLDGSTEHFANTTVQDLSFGANWSIAFWAYKNSDFLANQFMINIDEASGTSNEIRIEVTNSVQGRCDITIFDSAGSSNHFIRNDTTWTNSAWHHIVVTHSSGSTELYVNGSSAASDTSPTVTMTNTDRRINQWGKAWLGLFHSGAIWDVELDSDNVTAIYNSGDGTSFDLRSDSGNYDQSANLQHWWVFGGDDSSDSAMGTDWADGTDVNIMTNASNVTTADLTSGSPT